MHERACSDMRAIVNVQAILLPFRESFREELMIFMHSHICKEDQFACECVFSQCVFVRVYILSFVRKRRGGIRTERCMPACFGLSNRQLLRQTSTDSCHEANTYLMCCDKRTRCRMDRENYCLVPVLSPPWSSGQASLHERHTPHTCAE